MLVLFALALSFQWPHIVARRIRARGIRDGEPTISCYTPVGGPEEDMAGSARCCEGNPEDPFCTVMQTICTEVYDGIYEGEADPTAMRGKCDEMCAAADLDWCQDRPNAACMYDLSEANSAEFAKCCDENKEASRCVEVEESCTMIYDGDIPEYVDQEIVDEWEKICDDLCDEVRFDWCKSNTTMIIIIVVVVVVVVVAIVVIILVYIFVIKKKKDVNDGEGDKDAKVDDGAAEEKSDSSAPDPHSAHVKSVTVRL
jgi:hypothetical protein